MTTRDELRQLALKLPGVSSAPHHEIESFRIRGKIFATVPDDEHVRIMLRAEAIEAAIAECPLSCAPYYWGKRLACLVVELRSIEPDLVRSLLTEAWATKAPERLARESLSG